MIVTFENIVVGSFNFNEVVRKFDLRHLLEAQSYIASLPDSTSSWRFPRTLDEMDYVSPLNPVYVYGVEKISEISETWSSLFIRDGLLGVLYFFYHCSEPTTDHQVVFIHRSFASVVPEKWKKQILLYRHCVRPLPSPFGEKNKRKQLLIKASCDLLYWEKEKTNELIEDLKRILESTGPVEKVYFLPISSSQFNTRDKESSSFFDLTEIFSKNIPGFSFLNWHKVQAFQLLNGLEFVDLMQSKTLLSADNYSNLFFCSRGARPLSIFCQKNSPETFVPVSPGFGVSVSSFEDINSFSKSTNILREFEKHKIKIDQKEAFHFLKYLCSPITLEWGIL